MDNTYKLPEGFNSLEEALRPQSFREKTDIAEKQLFMTPGQMIIRRFFSNKLAVAGLIALLLMALFTFIVPLFYEYSETEIFYEEIGTGEELRSSDSDRIANATLFVLAPRSEKHFLGTNRDGQDMLARIMYGGRVSLMVGFVVVIVSLLIGIILGGVAGYYGGFIDGVIMRLVDIIHSIPLVPLMLMIAPILIALGISPQVKIYYTMFVLGFLSWPSVARMVRGNILSLRETEFMQAADATGIRVRHKIFRHLIPNTLPNLIVMATLQLGSVILMESTLSFLSVGVGAPYASWGNMVALVSDTVIMRGHPAVWVTPGICILITVLAFNFVGDGLRDATDPRMKR